MTHGLKASMALRYLFARKSHSAVTAISAVSVVGVAIATAAIVCVLSVFNGFRDVLVDRLDTITADVTVTPAAGKVISNGDSLASAIAGREGVVAAMPTVQDNALLLYGNSEVPVTLKGVRQKDFDKIIDLRPMLLTAKDYSLTDTTASAAPQFYYDPDFEEYLPVEDPTRYMAAVSVGVASRLRLPGNDENLLLLAPRRVGKVNLANPVASFLRDSVGVSAIWRSQQARFDNDLVITDLNVARRLFQYDTEATAIEMKLRPGTDIRKFTSKLASDLGDGFVVKDRLQSQETSFRMINIEKWVTFLLLSFILIIASFNIISTLSMLVLEKQDNMRTLRSLGASRGDVGGIFAWESVFVTLLGALSGLLLGLGLCLLQQHFGLIKLNGDAETLLITAYPVTVRAADIPMVLLPVVLVGAVASFVTAIFAKSRLKPVAEE